MRKRPEAVLTTHPGVGPVTALAMVLTVGPAERFGGCKDVGSYFGLIPREDSSGGKQRLGGISKQGAVLCAFCWCRGDSRRFVAMRSCNGFIAVWRAKKIGRCQSDGGTQVGHAVVPDVETQKTHAELVRMRVSPSHSGVSRNRSLE